MSDTDVVGVVPAAGHATRLGRLPSSKEVLPIGLDAEQHVVALCEPLLEAMRAGGAARAVIGIGPGKWDIPGYLGGGLPGLPVAYAVVPDSPSAAATAAATLPFVGDALVLFGFPDILFQPADAFLRLREQQARSNAPVVLGLFRAREPERVDMVDVDPSGRITDIVVKPSRTDLELAWILAVWTPEFSSFLTRHVTQAEPGDAELYVGDVIRAAIAAGLHVESVAFNDGDFRDVGVPADLDAVLRDGYASVARPMPT